MLCVFAGVTVLCVVACDNVLCVLPVSVCCDTANARRISVQLSSTVPAVASLALHVTIA